jgi:acyl-CoA thioesterase-2
MSKALSNLIDNIHLEKIEINIFRGVTLDSARGHVYGGQVLAQAINAAQRTVATPFVLHSLHAYFLRPGDADIPIVYEVDRIRDGRSFVTRRVVAIQHGRAIFNVSVSYQLREDGLDHQISMPAVEGPEKLLNDRVYYKEVLGNQFNAQFEWPIEYRQVAPIDPRKPSKTADTHYVWFKTDGKIADDLTQHQELLAYASDNHLLVSALRHHGLTNWSKDIKVASLDHVTWFHREFRIDDWLLYEIHSPSAAGGRAFTRGNIYSRDGYLVASTAQEGLVRIEKK